MRALGYAFTGDRQTANVVLYNTCSVREHAEQKVWSRLGELKERKRIDPMLVVGVMGCLAERDGTDLLRRMPVVDILIGPGELDKLPSLLDNAVKTRESLLSEPAPLENGVEPLRSARQVALQGSTSRRSATLAAAADTLELLDLSRSVSPIDEGGSDSPKRSAYVRITRGCNKFCTYCVVPFTRGAEIHRPPDHILDECKKLADSGVVEITLLGQTVNHYRFEHGAAVTVDGIVQPQKGRSYTGGHARDPFAGANVTTFADLLRRIHDEVPAIKRLRFVTSYPRDFGDDVLEVIRDHPRICRYLHVPAQSGSNRLLKLMNRGYEVEEYLEFLARARQYLDQPEIGRPLELSGDFIIGFPTETDEDYAATVDLITKAQYKNSFIFKYSPRPGTVAFDKMPDDVPEAVKRSRNNQLLALQASISEQRSLLYVGREMEVFVEGLSMRERKKRERLSTVTSGAVSLTINGKADKEHGHGSACAIDDECSSEGSSVAAPASGEIAQYAARTDTDMIVLFDQPAGASDRLVGSLQRVKVHSATALSLMATML
ncbi:MAG: MiaB/RimO family radical SAM methylthiotransferase [Planctomycetota bacterium]|nr:MiaB/RimO family radical SAM methylthiotransferase [Planctomycetota bacterium]